MRNLFILCVLVAWATASLAWGSEPFKKLPKKGREKIMETQEKIAIGEMASGLTLTFAGKISTYVLDKRNGETEAAAENYRYVKALRKDALLEEKIYRRRRSELTKKSVLSSAEERELREANLWLARFEREGGKDFYNGVVREARTGLIKRGLGRLALKVIGPVVTIEGLTRSAVLAMGRDPKVLPLVTAAEAVIPDKAVK